MAKRTTRQTDPDTTTAPERRRAPAAEQNGKAAAAKTTRSRRKTDASAPFASATDHTAEVTAVGAGTAIEPPVAARALATVADVADIHPSHDQIAERAYHIYLERGGPGDPFEDWLAAERELRERFVTV